MPGSLAMRRRDKHSTECCIAGGLLLLPSCGLVELGSYPRVIFGNGRADDGSKISCSDAHD